MMKILWLAGLLFVSVAARSEEGPAYGAELEGFDYPAPVQRYRFESQRQPVQMAYIDLRPQQPNGRTAVLLHGKNFCAATWEGTMRVLQQQGYRVIAPDQIGFCKSSKPDAYQYSCSWCWSIPSGSKTGRPRACRRSASTNGMRANSR